MKPTNPPTTRWTRPIKILVSGFILFHVLAVFWPPFRFATDGGSPFANYPDLLFEVYYQPLYLDHGYAFFAPNPGPTHVVDYRVFDDSGDVIYEGRFPSKKEHLPRLRYHRFFMLSENLNSLFVPPEEPAPSVSDEDRKTIARKRGIYVNLKTAIEQGLAAKHGGTHAVVERIAHRSPTAQEFWDGWSLTDPRLFERLPERLPKSEEELRP